MNQFVLLYLLHVLIVYFIDYLGLGLALRIKITAVPNLEPQGITKYILGVLR